MWERALFFAVFLLIMLAGGCSREMHSSPPAAHSATPPAPKEEGASTMTAAEQTIHIDNFTFDPAEVTVKVGTKVTWVNRDDVPHTATSTAKPKAFDSKALDTDQQFSFVFEKPGTYDYFCAVHPKMTGRVIVK